MSRVLVVDDEPANAALLEAMLKQHPGLEVRTETDSRRAERAFLDFAPDLLLLDLHMPTPDGLEILGRLRSARDSIGFLPVIVLSADESRLARNSALGLGADEFLGKPFDSAEVLLRVRNLLRTRQLYVELAAAKDALEQRDRRTESRR